MSRARGRCVSLCLDGDRMPRGRKARPHGVRRTAVTGVPYTDLDAAPDPRVLVLLLQQRVARPRVRAATRRRARDVGVRACARRPARPPRRVARVARVAGRRSRGTPTPANGTARTTLHSPLRLRDTPRATMRAVPPCVPHTCPNGNAYAWHAPTRRPSRSREPPSPELML